MDKKKLLALAIFLIMGFFMVTFANPSDQLTPVDNNANEPVANNTNANQPTPTDNVQNRPTTPAANAGTTTNTPIVTPVVDDNTDTQPTNDDDNNDPQVNVYTVTFVDHEGKALKIQAVAEHQDATASDITVLDYTVANMTYTFAKWDKDFTDVTTNLTVKALYNVKSIIAVVTIDGEKTDKTVEVYVNEDTENKKDVKLTDDNINEYINVDQLPEVNPGENNTVKELTYDEEDGYTIEIETELIDYTVTGTETDEGIVTVNGKDEIIANIGDEVVLANESKYGYDFVNYVVTEGNETTTLEATYDEEGNETTTITVGTSDITVSANYVRHEFDVVFKAHNFTSETQKVAYEGSATEPTLEEANKNYEEAGYAYSFADQWDVDFSKITADTVVNAIYTREAIDYDITYKYVIEGTTNEGFFAEGENTNRTSYTTEDSFRLVAPKKQGYDFVKWTENNKDVTGINAGEYGDRTFVAVFTPSKNTKYRVISYAQKLEVNPNAENAIDNYTIVKNVKYNYEGKATTASTVEVTPAAMPGFVTPAAKEETIAADGSTVYTFFYDRQEHTLTFKLNGNVMEGYPQTLKYGAAITAPELRAEEGYTLNGFGTVAKTMGEEDLTYEATITPNTNTKYTVVVNEENVDGTTKTTRTTKTGTTGTTVTETQSAKEGFNLDATSKEVTITGDGKAEVVFNYTRIKSTLTFIVKATDTNTVETVKTVENVRYGEEIATYKPSYTVAEGYSFVDWNTDLTMPAEDTTIEATVSPNTNTKYTVVVNEENVDGTTKTTRTTKTGTTGTTVTETQSAKEGFNLDATSKEVTITGDGKAEVVFNYTRIKSTLTFTIKDTDTNTVETVKTVEKVPYGARIASYAPTANDYTIAEGYNFTTWTLTGNMPAEAKTIEATKAIKKFTVTWVVDGKTTEVDTNVTYGSTPEYNKETPSKAPITDSSINYTYNYTYVGWTNKPQTVTRDVTITAKFVTLKARVADGRQLSYTINKETVDKANDLVVTVVDQDNNSTVVTNFDIVGFDNTTLTNGNNRTLNIEYKYSDSIKLTNNQLKYEILRQAFSSKFEVKLNITNGYRETKDSNCTENCDTDKKTRFVDTGDYNVLEVIEHYNQFVNVKSVSVDYGNGSTPLEFITDSEGKPKSVRWSEEVYWNGKSGLLNPVYIAKRKGNDYSNTFVKNTSNTTVKHGEKYPAYSYKDKNEKEEVSGQVCNDYKTEIVWDWLNTHTEDVPADCTYHHNYVTRTDQTKNLYRLNNDNKFEKYTPSGYLNVDDENNRIQTVTVTYHRDANPTDHESAGNYVVVFEYDRVLNKFVCIDEHEVK